MPLKICPNCHKGCNEENEYCPTCKTKLPDINENLRNVDYSKSVSGIGKKPSINPVIIVIAIIGLIIVAHFSLGVFFPKPNESTPSLQSNAPSPTLLITTLPTRTHATLISTSTITASAITTTLQPPLTPQSDEPFVLSVSPSQGVSGQPAQLTITGRNFRPDTVIVFSNKSVYPPVIRGCDGRDCGYIDGSNPNACPPGNIVEFDCGGSYDNNFSVKSEYISSTTMTCYFAGISNWLQKSDWYVSAQYMSELKRSGGGYTKQYYNSNAIYTITNSKVLATPPAHCFT